MKKMILTILYFTTFQVFSQNLNLELNIENAVKTYEYLSTPTSNKEDINEILNLPSTIGMIEHDGKFDNKLTKENFVLEIDNPSSKTDAFRFKRIRKNLEAIETTIRILNDSIDYLKRRIESNLNLYSNNIPSKKIQMNFILGGNSDGYTTDENTFNIEMQFFGNDIEGIIILVTHELYHIIQTRIKNDNVTKKLNNKELQLYNIIDNLYKEGSASFMSDPLNIQNPKKYSIFLQEKYERNLNKIEESFYLLECIISHINTGNASNELLYNIGFGGQWDSPLYFVGYQICKELEIEYGNYHIKKYLTTQPTFLLIEYIELYRNNLNITNRFSSRTENAIYDLHRRTNKKGNH